VDRLLDRQARADCINVRYRHKEVYVSHLLDEGSDKDDTSSKVSCKQVDPNIWPEILVVECQNMKTHGKAGSKQEYHCGNNGLQDVHRNRFRSL
jgi:hypothetical protein